MNKIYKRECESSCEYSLPDYMGDVKKILTTSAVAIPSGKFATDGQVQFSGVVLYDILYSDSDGKMTRLTANSDYDISVGVDSEEYVDSAAEVRVSSLNVRLTGPRKLVAKATLSASISVEGDEDLKCAGDVFTSATAPEVASRNIEVKSLAFASSPEREYAEEVERFNSLTADDIEIIASSGRVRIIEAVTVEGGVSVKGELILTAIIRTEEQPPFAIKKTIPFEQVVTVEGTVPEMQAMADGYLTSVTFGVCDDTDGCTVTVNAIAELTCTVGKNKSVELITDAYLKERDTRASYEDFSYESLVCMANCEESFEVKAARIDIGCEKIRDILTISCDVRSCEKKITPTGFEISGEAVLSGIACEVNEENNVSYLPVKFTAPFSVNVNCGCQIPSDSSVCVSLSPIDVDSTLDAQTLCAKCALKIGYTVSSQVSATRLTECNIYGEEEYKSRTSTVTVYYPEEGESLFGVAKKFHTTTAKIASDNNLSEGVLKDGDSPLSKISMKRLIIR